MEKGLDQASLEAGELMATRAQVYPVAANWHNVKMRDGDPANGGEIVYGEHLIDNRKIQFPGDVEVELYTEEDGSSTGVPLNPHLEEAVNNADAIVVGPGSVYTSIVPALSPDGMPEALGRMQTADAKPAYDGMPEQLAGLRGQGRTLAIIANLATQETETEGWTGQTYVTETEKYAKRKVDVIVYNQDVDDIPGAVVFDRTLLSEMGEYHVVGTNLVKEDGPRERSANDPLRDQRSKVAHDMAAATIALIGTDARRGDLVNA
jgi:2-phospho-L-lactate transferase/gluconeogenesis factor (CofD/UPF0052 family)